MRAMVQVRLFADIDGQTVELFGYVSGMERAEFCARFPRVTGRRFDRGRFQVARDAAGRVFPVTRSIEYKKTRSPKRCDARCLGARGKNCECACGGINHGRGDAGASGDLFDAAAVPERAGFFEDRDARIEEIAADFALDFMGGALDLGGEQTTLAGIGGGGEAPRAVDPRQSRLF